MVKIIFFALIVLCVVCLMLFATTTLTNGGQVYKTFAAHPDTPPAAGLLVWAKSDGTFQITNSVGTDSAMGGSSGAGPHVMGTALPGDLVLPAGTALFGPPLGGGVYSSNNFESLNQLPFSAAGTISKFCASIGYTVAQPGTGTLVYTLRVNGTDSLIVVTIASGTASPATVCDNTHTASISSGDLVSVNIRNNASANSAHLGGYSYLFQ